MKEKIFLEDMKEKILTKKYFGCRIKIIRDAKYFEKAE